jgi:predicted RNA-binding Zn ribbon-like protein
MVSMMQDPGGRAPAPGALRLVQAFVNTVDLEHGREELDSPRALRELLVRLDLIGKSQPVVEGDLQRARELRAALQALLLANNGGEVDRESLATLDRAARAAHLTVRFDGGVGELVPEASGVDAALGRLIAIVHTAMTAGSWSRLKACRRDICHWIFYDRSRNRSSTWCAMSVCGNRTKTKAYRRRRSSTRPTTAP